MADMSHDEKRAAGLRKLKKYQQHKTSSSTSKSTRKKQDSMNQNNGEAYRVFTGFSEHGKNGIQENCNVPPLIADSIQNQIPSSDVKYTENSFIDNSEEQENGSLIDRSDIANTSCDTLSFMPTQTSVVQETIPLASNIFSNSSSLGASNFSDFFDNIKSSEQSISSSFLSPNRTVESSGEEAQSNVDSSTNEEAQINTDKIVNLLMSEAGGQSSIVSEVHHCESNSSSHSVTSTDIKDDMGKNIGSNQINSADSTSSVLPLNFASSAESLRQLSLELSGLIDESVSNPVPQSSEMERRNLELASLLASEQQKCERLQLQMKEYEARVSQLQIEASQHQTDQLARLQRELSAVQEQLQLHVQTVGILVGEKTELEASLSKSQQMAKQKAAEVEELQGRLKASRHRVGDLERELSVTTAANKQSESSVQQQSKELSRLKLEKEMATKQLEETEEEVAELRQNLVMRSTEVQTLQQELREKQSQLDLAQLRVQQLSLSDMTDMERQLESLHQHKVGLERQVAELQQSVQALGSERDQANSQYQEYLHHVNGQMKSMADKLAAATAENEQLSAREQSLVKHLSELEKQLQQQQQQNQRNRAKDSPSHAASAEMIQRLEKNIRTLEEEKEKLNINMDNQLQENKLLQDQLDLYMSKNEELESMVESLKADQPDTRKLLAAMESDKVAASRAVGQNQKLKEQLLELEERFIQVSNHKVELTQELQKEQHLSKELGERLAQQELEISELRTQLAENEKLLDNIQKSSSEQLSRQMLKEDQIVDQMRHYEAQGQMTEILKNELHQSKELCRNLHIENDELRMKLAQIIVPENTGAIENQRDEVVESLKASVRQLTMERDQLLSQMQQGKPSLNNIGTDAPDNSFCVHEVDVKEYCNMKEAMEKLEERFTKTMAEVADLSEEKQRLEHLVLQLQGETETIGEYIALYQTQRSILRQRAQEKDEQLARLARDREEVKIKLNELNRLIGQLVTENGKSSTNVPTSASSPDKNGETKDELAPFERMLMNGGVTMKQETIGETEQLKSEIEHLHTPPAKTADKIMALLSEIETSTLVEPRNVESFHPCPWCSGRLITV